MAVQYSYTTISNDKPKIQFLQEAAGQLFFNCILFSNSYRAFKKKIEKTETASYEKRVWKFWFSSKIGVRWSHFDILKFWKLMKNNPIQASNLISFARRLIIWALKVPKLHTCTSKCMSILEKKSDFYSKSCFKMTLCQRAVLFFKNFFLKNLQIG